VLPVHAATIRLFVHVLAATVWVGGQLTLAGLVPALRSLGPEATRAAARRFDRIAWPAYVVLVATGVWNLLEIRVGDTTTAYQATLGLKLVLVAASGVGAALHRRSTTTLALAIGGAVAGLGAVGALFLGVNLRT
jgi:putative copper export protein